jgi:hypothetical protein
MVNKDRIQEIFADLADSRYGKEYWELSKSIHYTLYL